MLGGVDQEAYDSDLRERFSGYGIVDSSLIPLILFLFGEPGLSSVIEVGGIRELLVGECHRGQEEQGVWIIQQGYVGAL